MEKPCWLAKMKSLRFILSVFITICVLVSFSMPIHAEVTQNLVAYYPFNGNANDESGNGNNGIVYGATLTTDRFGNANRAYSFDGLDDYINIGDNSILKMTEGLTLSAWVKMASFIPIYQNIISDHAPNEVTEGPGKILRFEYGNLQFIVGGIYGWGTAEFVQYPFDNTMLSVWHHIVGTYDRNTIKLFLDGIKVASKAYTGPITVNSNPILIGKSGFGEFLQGVVDDVRIYNRALFESEIQDIFTSGGGNQPPVASAGPDQTVHVGASVTLDGSGSSDPDGNTPLSFAWGIISKPLGSMAALSDPTVSMPSFTPDVTGDYTIQLVVTDSLGAASAPDTVNISTFNSTPVADAGPDQLIIRIGSTVQLDGSNSYDLDGDRITYAWSLTQRPQDSTAVLSDPSIPNPTFVADYYGNYVATLVVIDRFGATSSPDTVTVSFTNVKPVANAGGNQAVAVGQTIFLSGSGSTDANGDTLSYNWSLVSRPAGSLAVLANLTGVNTSFVADMPGIYVVSLVVNDGLVNSDPASVTITATSAVNEVVQKLGEAINTINALCGITPSVFKNPNMGNALTNKINAVLDKVNQGLYQEAIDKLQNDILAKTDGCALTGAPDKNDWIKECTSQGQVYPLIIQAINLLKSLI